MDKPNVVSLVRRRRPGLTARCFSTAACVFSFAFLAITLFRLAGSRGYDKDEFQHLETAWRIQNGAVPYRDFYECHPFTYALALNALGVSRMPVDEALLLARRLSVGLLLMASCAVAGLAREVELPGLAWVYGVSFVCAPAVEEKGFEVRPDGPGLLLLICAAYILIAANNRRYTGSRRAVANFAAGLCAAGCFLISPPEAFVIGALAALCVAFLRPAAHADGPRSAVGWILPAATGAAVAIAPFVLSCVARHVSLRQMFGWCVTANLFYPRHDRAPAELLRIWILNPAWSLAVMAGTSQCLRTAPESANLSRRTRDFLLCGAACTIAVPLLSPVYGPAQYALWAMPPLSLLAALGAWEILGIPRRVRPLPLCAAMPVLLYAGWTMSARVSDAARSPVRSIQLAVQQRVRRYARPADPVLFGFGYPDMGGAAHQQTPGYFGYDPDDVVGMPVASLPKWGPWRRAVAGHLAELARAKPTVIVTDLSALGRAATAPTGASGPGVYTMDATFLQYGIAILTRSDRSHAVSTVRGPHPVRGTKTGRTARKTGGR